MTRDQNFGLKLRGLAFAVCVVALLGTVVYPNSRLKRGSPIQTKLHDAIRNAQKVVVIVHSGPWDNPAADIERMKNFKEQILQTVELLPAQRNSLLGALPKAKDLSDRTSTACIFDPHHRIEILNPDGSRLIWEVCFHCGQHFVEGDHVRILPLGWPDSLKRCFESQNIRVIVPQT